jgi:CheY-like chemotaxis protein
MTDQPLRIVIVDDSPEDRELYRRHLSSHPERKYKFFEAETGAQGLVECRLRAPDCVLLDYRLPDLDGLEFLQKLRGRSPVLPVPVVMLTGLGNPEVEDKALEGGVIVYLDKNHVTPLLISAAVQRAIKHHQKRLDMLRT